MKIASFIIQNIDPNTSSGAPNSSSMPRAGNLVPPSLISFHPDCWQGRGAHLHCSAAFFWAASEGRSLSCLSSLHSLPSLGSFPPLFSLLSRSQESFKFRAGWQELEENTRPFSCPSARSFGILFPSPPSLFDADWRLGFPSHNSS